MELPEYPDICLKDLSKTMTKSKQPVHGSREAGNVQTVALPDLLAQLFEDAVSSCVIINP